MSRVLWFGLLGVGAALALAGLRPTVAEGPVAEIVYVGGDIVTLDDARPTAEALAVSGGTIVAVGSRAEVMRLAGAETRIVDLEGRTLLPGFVDPHSHLSGVGIQAVAANLRPPPDGEARDIPTLQRLLRQWATAHPDAGIVLGLGYDDSQLAEGRHPTRDELDAVSTEVPVVAVHASGHLAAVNGKALERAGITAETEDPAGGTIRRRPGSREPDGVLEELAFWSLLPKVLPASGPEEAQALLRTGLETYARFGYTTVQEGRATPGNLTVLAEAARSGALPLDVVVYPDVAYAGTLMNGEWVGRTYQGRLRIAGVKLNLDGSPQGRTAWMSEPYFRAPEGREAGYAGYPAETFETVYAQVDEAFARGWQVAAHCNGDAAIEQFIEAVRVAQAKYGPADRRPVAIHAFAAREDQLDAMQQLGIVPSFFPMHTFYWGDWHRETVLGPARADRIAPTGSALVRGLRFTTHHDAPVAPPDSMRVLSATVSRRTRSGDILGPAQRVSPLVALKAMTLWPAWQLFEEDRKGSLEAGKVADLVVLSANPLKVDPETLAAIRVVETIKEGRTVFRAQAPTADAAPPAAP